MTFLLTHNSVIDNSGVNMLHNNILNEVTLQAATGLANRKIFRQEYTMQLNDSTAMAMFQTKLMHNYIDYDFDTNVFMSALLFPLTCGFSDTSYIVNFKASIYASIFINHYYVEYYQQYDDYDLCIFSSIQRGEAKIYSSFLSLSLIQEI